jgi:hypothetical protein
MSSSSVFVPSFVASYAVSSSSAPPPPKALLKKKHSHQMTQRRRHPPRQRRSANTNAVSASNNEGEDENKSSSLAPATPTSPHGEMLEYILSTEPQSFEAAIESVLEKLSDEIDSSSSSSSSMSDEKKDSKDSEMSLTLYKRISDIKRMDRRRAVEDAMYASIIHKVLLIDAKTV